MTWQSQEWHFIIFTSPTHSSWEEFYSVRMPEGEDVGAILDFCLPQLITVSFFLYHGPPQGITSTTLISSSHSPLLLTSYQSEYDWCCVPIISWPHTFFSRTTASTWVHLRPYLLLAFQCYQPGFLVSTLIDLTNCDSIISVWSAAYLFLYS